MIKIDRAKVCITERILREIIAAVDEAKEKIEFITDPISNCDMDETDFILSKLYRGILRITSPYLPVEFEVDLEINPNQERAQSDYRLNPNGHKSIK